MEQGVFRDPHGIEGIHSPQDGDGNELIIGGDGPLSDCSEEEDDGESECDDGNNEQVHGDPPEEPHSPRRSRRGHGPSGTQRPWNK